MVSGLMERLKVDDSLPLELGEPRAVDRPAVGPLEGRMQELAGRLADRRVAGRRVFWRAHLP